MCHIWAAWCYSFTLCVRTHFHAIDPWTSDCKVKSYYNLRKDEARYPKTLKMFVPQLIPDTITRDVTQPLARNYWGWNPIGKVIVMQCYVNHIIVGEKFDTEKCARVHYMIRKIHIILMQPYAAYPLYYIPFVHAAMLSTLKVIYIGHLSYIKLYGLFFICLCNQCPCCAMR